MLSCKVFVSCGQNSEDERQVAGDVCSLLRRLGFQPYLAVQVQTIPELNAAVIRELKDSDAFLFINFRREKISENSYRGSLFCHQEFAIAYSLGFEKLIVVNQLGCANEGMLGHIVNNTESFSALSDCCRAVEQAVERASWKPDYSRSLHAGSLRSQFASYGNLVGQLLYLGINNDRPDTAALEATARLSRFGEAGKSLQPSPIRSPLKATMRQGFAHTIFPKSHEEFDILCVGNYLDPADVSIQVPSVSGTVVTNSALSNQVFLNCALDVAPLPPLPITPGVWVLEYEFFAISFPILTVEVELTLSPHGSANFRFLQQRNR